jgi:hypothetical protein
VKRETGKDGGQTDTFPENSHEEYLLALVELFEKPSSSSAFSTTCKFSKYAAAKQADQLGDRSLSRRILQLKEATPNDANVYRRLARGKEDGNLAEASYFTGRTAVASRQYLFVAQSWNVAADPMPTRKSATKGYCLRSFLYRIRIMPWALEHTQGQLRTP